MSSMIGTNQLGVKASYGPRLSGMSNASKRSSGRYGDEQLSIADELLGVSPQQRNRTSSEVEQQELQPLSLPLPNQVTAAAKSASEVGDDDERQDDSYDEVKETEPNDEDSSASNNDKSMSEEPDVSSGKAAEAKTQRTETAQSTTVANQSSLTHDTHTFHKSKTGERSTKRFRVLRKEADQEQALDDERVERCDLKQIISPHASEKLIWDHIVLAMIMYTLVMIPLEMAFNPLDSDLSLGLDIVITVVFAVNMAVQFRTAVEHNGRVIYDPYTIAWHYVSKWFWLDLIATVPWDLIFAGAVGSDGSALAFARLTRLARVMRLFSSDRFSVTYSKTLIRILRMLGTAVMLAHWLGCVWYMLSRFEDWSGEGIVPEVTFRDETLSFRYLICFHFAVRALISMGSELTPTTTAQAYLCLLFIVCGVILFSVIIGNIEILLAQSAATSIRFQEHVQSLGEFCEHHKLSKRMKENILDHTTNWYRTNRGMDEAHLLSCLPAETQKKVYRHMYKEELSKCKFFENSSGAFLDAICTEVRREVALRGDIIIRQGSLGGEMYIIEQGECEALDLVTREVHAVIPEGAFFGEIALFTTLQRTVSVRARTFMKLFVLTKDSFMHLLQFFPQEKKLFMKVAQARLQNTRNIAAHIASTSNLEEIVRDSVLSKEDVAKLLQEDGLDDVFDIEDVMAFISQWPVDEHGQLHEDDKEQVLGYLHAKADRLRAVQRAIPDSGGSEHPNGNKPKSKDLGEMLNSKTHRPDHLHRPSVISVNPAETPFHGRSKSLSHSHHLDVDDEPVTERSASPASVATGRRRDVVKHRPGEYQRGSLSFAGVGGTNAPTRPSLGSTGAPGASVPRSSLMWISAPPPDLVDADGSIPMPADLGFVGGDTGGALERLESTVSQVLQSISFLKALHHGARDNRPVSAASQNTSVFGDVVDDVVHATNAVPPDLPAGAAKQRRRPSYVESLLQNNPNELAALSVSDTPSQHRRTLGPLTPRKTPQPPPQSAGRRSAFTAREHRVKAEQRERSAKMDPPILPSSSRKQK